MSADLPAVLTVEDFVRQVEQACSDLPEPLRHRLMSDLDGHIREMAEHGDPLSALGSPLDYARDFRAAMNLPEPRQPTSERRPWLMPVLIAAVAAAVALGVIAIAVAVHTNGTGSPSLNPTQAPPASSSASRAVLVPYLVGLTETNAMNQAFRAGFQVQVTTVASPAIPRGLVLLQSPAASLDAPTGSTIEIKISSGP
jgi:hypothetical protein